MNGDDITQFIRTQQYHITAGITNTTANVYLPAVVSEKNVRIEYVAGGSLLVFGVTVGMTLAAATLVAYFNSLSFIQVAQANPVEFNGPASFYLAANGATCIAQISQGYGYNGGLTAGS